MLLKKVRAYIGEFRAYNRERKQVVRSAILEKNERLKGRIVRYVHSVEKGLSLDSPRPEFGYEKIKTLYTWIEEYLETNDADKVCVYMAADALSAYCDYHDSIGVSSCKIDEIKNIAAKLSQIKNDDNITGVFGGVQMIKKSDMLFDTATVKSLFETRHSIRQFTGDAVSKELIYDAVKLAQSAPSACNRQAVRVYAIDSDKFIKTYPANLQGVGGFVENSDKILLITGKISPYEEFEYKQFIVSAGIFAGYLDLALHSLGVGACVVQRSLRPNDEWKTFCETHSISLDEQIICMLVVGQLKEETVVPVSKRFNTDSILRFL